MFYRRKVILAIIEIFGGTIEKIALQKLLVLFTKRQVIPDYDFVPYHFGCHSFSADADLTAMVKHGLLIENDKSFSKIDLTDYASQLSAIDKKILIEIFDAYGKMSSSVLMKHTYLNFHNYAII